jgi:16S rRNA (cytidine1402-2'-O)-methyltransferase
MAGTLWLIPMPLGASAGLSDVLSPITFQQIDAIRCFVVETPKVARAFLKPALTGALTERQWLELNQHAPTQALEPVIKSLLGGTDVGLVSDAGCPGVADPGALLVARVHQEIASGANIKIRPLIGPSSILLALMASGMNGQSFAFVGYLPSSPDERGKALIRLQARSAKNRETILMIETPYRSKSFLQTALNHLAGSTQFMSASQLSLPEEHIVSCSISQWRKITVDKRVLQQLAEPTVFALLAA